MGSRMDKPSALVSILMPLFLNASLLNFFNASRLNFINASLPKVGLNLQRSSGALLGPLEKPALQALGLPLSPQVVQRGYVLGLSALISPSLGVEEKQC